MGLRLGTSLGLVHLVLDGVLACTETCAEGSVRVLGDLLVGLLGGTRGHLVDLPAGGVDGAEDEGKWGRMSQLLLMKACVDEMKVNSLLDGLHC